ncbi:hypothetical protein [Alteromonas oceanisediminis]|uniref:hypothetical protein n=1 Tax=Alteromonas oceanisediminis TaxID=2836180 RepID=UPI001BD95445|nr:hypothetical protein [Alteromonas oceanisediminis]MBT0587004.1 hypothetical protein [Alteromonas oceanisediminis]
MDSGMIFVFIILFGFVLPIVFIGVWTSHKKDMAKLNTKLGESEKHDLQNQVNAMKKRLEVLEAIVTDKKYQLNDAFADLDK